MKLAEFQNLLKKQKIDAYLVNHKNRFPGQDILPEENSILELTGFSGSAGNLLVLQDKAILIVDGRYEIQSKMETDPQAVEILCNPTATPFSAMVWLFDSAKKYKLMYDPWTVSHSDLMFYCQQLPQVKFIADDKALLGSRLSTKQVTVFEHKIEYCGMERDEKIAEVIKQMIPNRLDALLVTQADNVSWLLNLRSDALPDTPVLRAYALIDKNFQVNIFADYTDYPGIQPFSNLKKTLKAYGKQKIGLTNDTPQIIYDFLPNPKCVHPTYDIIEKIKAVKNPVELQGMRNAHLRDAVAMVKFLHWLDNNWHGKSELDIVAKLRSFREEQELFYSDSFPTIAGFGSNGAIVHYQPNEKTNLQLKKDSILLLDSGAQYYDGTTDITRTIALGTPSPKMINDFTTVLKCHIELASCYFPLTADGKQLDSLCRRQIWATGKDYKHGTGHGVGCFLNVHEGPNLISPKAPRNVYQPGMITSIEPGYYKENAYGIRIENLVETVKAENEDFEVQMLKFKPLTLVPVDKRLINKYLLSEGEISWLNDYHATVWSNLKELIDKEEVLTWLEEACSPL